MTEISALYRASLFDGVPSVDWLRPGWRALRLYGRQAKRAMEDGDLQAKADMLSRADRLLTIMTGILDTGEDNVLGRSLMHIYGALRLALLDANMGNDSAPLDDFDGALRVLDTEFMKLAESASEWR